MKVIRATARSTRQAPHDKFTGLVLQDEIVVGVAPSRLRATRVSFTPGARTAWHTHPVGQVLYVLSGVGHVQCEPERAVILQPGDTVLIPPGVRHWHGAAPENLFVHLAMSETTDQGEATTWFEHVTDADYRQATKAAS